MHYVPVGSFIDKNDRSALPVQSKLTGSTRCLWIAHKEKT